MKKSLIALAVLATTGAAFAQSSVTLFGRLDAGIGRVTTESTGTAPVASRSQTLLTTSALSTTYWGLKGTEDLGGGLKANFELQSAFNVDTGAASNTLFERYAVLGLSGGFGSVNLGRQYTAYHSMRADTNNVWDTNVNANGTVWSAGLADYALRASNSIRYDSPEFNGVSGAVVIGLGENEKVGAANLGDATNSTSFRIRYAAGPLLVGYAHQEEVQPLTVAGAAQNTRKFDVFAGSYDFGVAKITGAYNKAKDNSTQNDKEYQFGVNVPVSANAAVGVGYNKATSTRPGLVDLSGKGYTLAGYYSLSKRTTLYAGYVSTEVETAVVNAKTAAKTTTMATGVRHTF